ncbi:hypothetical protein Tco_0786580 [Tanacetum coccineum]
MDPSDTMTTLPSYSDPKDSCFIFSWRSIQFSVSPHSEWERYGKGSMEIAGYTSDDMILYTGKFMLRRFFLKMNLPDHRSVLMDLEDQVMVEMEIPCSSGVNSQPHAHT